MSEITRFYLIQQGKELLKPMAEEAFFFIICPCNCGRALPIEYSPFANDIPEFGNKIWQYLVDDKGLEGAVQYLHETVEVEA